MYQQASYWHGTDTLSTGNRQATDNSQTNKRQSTKLFLSFSVDSQPGYRFRTPVPRVHGEEMECYEQHVYSYESSFSYIKGKLGGHYVTLKRYRWEEKDQVQQEQFSNEVSVLR